MAELKTFTIPQGKTIAQFASDIGVHRETVRRWIKGFHRPLNRIPTEAKNLARDRHVHVYTAVRWMRGEHQPAKRIRLDESIFDAIDSQPKAYWLGFLMADGNVHMSKRRSKLQIGLVCHRRDEHHLIKFAKFLKTNASVCHRTEGARQINVWSNRLGNSLIALGCVPRKSLVLKFPRLEPSLVSHFIRGYFDGDGCASLHNGKTQLRLTFCGTFDFLSDLRNILGGRGSFRKLGNIWQLAFNGNRVAKAIADYMYKDATVFLKRKWEVCHPDG